MCQGTFQFNLNIPYSKGQNRANNLNTYSTNILPVENETKALTV